MKVWPTRGTTGSNWPNGHTVQAKRKVACRRACCGRSSREELYQNDEVCTCFPCMTRHISGERKSSSCALSTPISTGFDPIRCRISEAELFLSSSPSKQLRKNAVVVGVLWTSIYLAVIFPGASHLLSIFKNLPLTSQHNGGSGAPGSHPAALVISNGRFGNDGSGSSRERTAPCEAISSRTQTEIKK